MIDHSTFQRDRAAFEQRQMEHDVDVAASEVDLLRGMDHKIGAVLWELEEALRDIRVAKTHNQPITTRMKERLDRAHYNAGQTLSQFTSTNGGLRT